MKPYLFIALAFATMEGRAQQLPSQIQAKRGVFTERLFLNDRWIDRISTNIPSIYDSSNNVLPTTKAMADLFRLHSLQSASVTPDGDYIHNWNHKNLHIDSINRLQFDQFETDSTFPLLAPKIHNTFRMQPGMLADSAINLISVMRNMDNSWDSTTSRFSLSPMGAFLHTDNTLGSFNVNLGGNSVRLGAYFNNGDWPQSSMVSVSPQSLELYNTDGNIFIGRLNIVEDTTNYNPIGYDNNTGQLVRMNSWHGSATVTKVTKDTTYLPIYVYSSADNVESAFVSISSAMRIGNIVHVSGLVTVNPYSASGTITSMQIDLPWFSNQINKYTCTGTGFNVDYQMGAQITGDPVYNRARFKFASLTTDPVEFTFSFQYIINNQGE